MGGGVPKPSLAGTYRTASQPQLIFSFPQTRLALTSSHTHTRRDLSGSRVHGLLLSRSPADRGSACPDMCHPTPRPQTFPISRSFRSPDTSRVLQHQSNRLRCNKGTRVIYLLASPACCAPAGVTQRSCSRFLTGAQRYRAGYRFLPFSGFRA